MRLIVLIIFAVLSTTIHLRLAEAQSAAVEMRVFADPSWCGPCRQLEAYLKERGIQIDEKGNGDLPVEIGGAKTKIRLRFIKPDEPDAKELGYYIPDEKGKPVDNDGTPAIPFMTVFINQQRVDNGKNSSDEVTNGKAGASIERVLSIALKSNIKLLSNKPPVDSKKAEKKNGSTSSDKPDSEELSDTPNDSCSGKGCSVSEPEPGERD